MSKSRPAAGFPNFDRVARIYRWAEYLALGPALQRTRTHWLKRLIDCRRAAVIGDGDGRFLAALLRAAPALQAVAVDSSAAMLGLLRRRCARAGAGDRVQLQHGSVLEFTPDPGCDLVVTHFVLDCFSQPEVEQLVARFTDVLRPGTLWLVSDFDVPSAPVLRAVAKVYIRALYLAFRITVGLRVQRLPSPADALSRAGLERVCRHSRLGGLLYTELWQLPVRCQGQRTESPPKLSAMPFDYAQDDPDLTLPPDPLPNPEPPVPPLPGPDPAVFHHDVHTPEPARRREES